MQTEEPLTEPEQNLIEFVLNSSTHRRFMSEIDTPGKDAIHCGLDYLVLEEFDDWMISVLVNHEVVQVGAGGLEIMYGQAPELPHRAPREWLTINPLTPDEAAMFDIPEEVRDILNEGLMFLRKNAPAPEIQVFDGDYIESEITNYEDYLWEKRSEEQQTMVEEPDSPFGLEKYSEEEINEQVDEYRDRKEKALQKREGERFTIGPLRQLSLGSLEYILWMAENGKFPDIS